MGTACRPMVIVATELNGIIDIRPRSALTDRSGWTCYRAAVAAERTFALARSPEGSEYAVKGHATGWASTSGSFGAGVPNRIIAWLVSALFRGQYTVSVWTSPPQGLPKRKWKERADYRGTAEDRVEDLGRLIESGEWTPAMGSPPK